MRRSLHPPSSGHVALPPLPSSARATAAPSLDALLAEHGLILLYDGVCGLCDRSVQFILRHDRTGTMRFATLQGALGESARKRLPQLAGVDSVILLHPGGAWVRSTAVLEVLRYLGSGWGVLGALGYLLPRVLRDWMYGVVARTRYRLFGQYASCPLPSPETRGRFLDS